MQALISIILDSINEVLTTAVVIVAFSMLLYNLTRNLRNRVARNSAAVLACVTGVYICDVLVVLEPSVGTITNLLRIQWIGIAFLPSAMFHLSDALLETTGLPSRGRRRRVTRIMYLISAGFTLLAAFTDTLIIPTIDGTRFGNVRAGIAWPVYLAFFIVGIVSAFINVNRARQRCLTRDTRRRMGYLQIAMLTAPGGTFPFAVLLGFGGVNSVGTLLLVNASNLVIILMLLFLSYPLSFFGSRQPDRLVKTDLLRFMLRGPSTAVLALIVIIFTRPAAEIIGLPGQTFMPFAVVAVVLIWQWGIALGLPSLEKRLIYSGEDDSQLARLQDLSERLLTRNDLQQLLEVILRAMCDYLQVKSAFAIAFQEEGPELVAAIGPSQPDATWLRTEAENLRQASTTSNDQRPILREWHSYWITPQTSQRLVSEHGEPLPIGIIGIQARSTSPDLNEDEMKAFIDLSHRAAETLDDMQLQDELYASLEGLLPQISITRARAAEVEYKPGRTRRLPPPEVDSSDREQFIEQVRAALRHYWGGPGLSGSKLLELQLVRQALPDNDENPSKALRAVLHKAIERQKPNGDRKLTAPEWTIYNILVERFIERHKVRDVAIRLALSEPDLYRKQRVAIEVIADTLLEMERDVSSPRLMIQP
ncbi:MAG TPA: hypothetical protein PLQ56_03405 [Aggregatilineales bacterium]|nr:hypothetical protein [Aggregatilineales bacterium]